MLAQRFPTPLILAAPALFFSIAGILQHNPTPLVTALIMAQALSLFTAYNHPRISTATYIAAFICALLVGHSAGFELFLGVFLITAITATGHYLLTALITATVTLGGFYSPTDTHFEFDIGAAIIFSTVVVFAYLLGFWIRRTQQHHLNAQRTQRDRRQRFTSLLHDTIAADLTSVIVQLEKLAITTPQRGTELKYAAHTARNALDKTRQLLNTLNALPETRPTPSLTITLDAMTQRLRNHGFTVTLTTDLAVPVTMTLHNDALERVLSEAVTNIIKYATPQSLVSVSTRSNDQGVTVTIANSHTPGRKISTSTRLGLASMSNTLYAVGGTLKIRNDDREWVTIANIPFSKNYW